MIGPHPGAFVVLAPAAAHAIKLPGARVLPQHGFTAARHGFAGLAAVGALDAPGVDGWARDASPVGVVVVVHGFFPFFFLLSGTVNTTWTLPPMSWLGGDSTPTILLSRFIMAASGPSRPAARAAR